MLAASGGHDQCVAQLIDANADIAMKDNAGNTAIQLAAKRGHEKCAQRLTVKGVNGVD
jgi:ankyrin repeat protein